jgi:hypothetical protein
LIFKIIFIRKSQIYIFGMYLNLFEFETGFDLDLKLGFKFNSAAKVFRKHFYFSFAGQLQFGPNFTFSPAAGLLFSLFISSVCPSVSPGPVSLWDQPITVVFPFLQTVFSSTTTVGFTPAAARPNVEPACPLPSCGKMERCRRPYASPPHRFPLPIKTPPASPIKNRRLSCHLDQLPPRPFTPIKGRCTSVVLPCTHPRP